MPALPLTPAQIADAQRLSVFFKAWQVRQKASGLPSSQEAVAPLLGFNQSALSQYLAGKIPLNVTALVKFARLLAVPPADISKDLAREIDDIAGASVPKAPIDLEATPGLIAIQKVAFRISAGIAGFAVDFKDDGDGVPLFLPQSWADSKRIDPSKLYATRASGSSMEPGILDHDVVVVNTGDIKREKDTVFAFNHEGEFTVKRAAHEFRRWWLFSDNPDQKTYPPIECSDSTFLLGRIVHLHRDM